MAKKQTDNLPATNPTLRELILLGHEAMQLLANNGGEITEEVDKKLQELEARLPDKADGYKHIYDEMVGQSEIWSKRAAELDRIADSCVVYAEKLKERIKFAMESLKVEELCGTTTVWRLQNNKPSVILVDEKVIPDGHKKVSISFDLPFNLDTIQVIISAIKGAAQVMEFNAPDNWIKVETKVNKNSVYEDLKNELPVSGAKLEQTKHVRPYANTKR